MNKSLKEMAVYYMSNIIAELTPEYKIDPIFLDGYSEQELRKSIQNYHAFLTRVFDFFSCTDGYEEKDLTAIRNLLFIFGIYGELNENGIELVKETYINSVKKAKITKVERYFIVLKKLGFCFGELDVENLKFISPAYERVTVTFPEAPDLFIALHAFSNICQKMNLDRTMFHCDYKVFENSKLKQPKATLEDCIGSLSEENKAFIRELNDYLLANGYKLEVHDQVYKGTYLHKKTRYPIVVFYIECGKFDLKINGEKIKDYIDFFRNLPKNMFDACLSGKDCDQCCPTCRKGYEFEYQDKIYSKCRAESFRFPVAQSNLDILKEFVVKECEESSY
jgi:hypothetical protein